jgi:hypothetical protein
MSDATPRTSYFVLPTSYFYTFLNFVTLPTSTHSTT